MPRVADPLCDIDNPLHPGEITILAILLGDQPKMMVLKIWKVGGFERGLQGSQVQLLPGGFLQRVRDVDRPWEGFWLF